MPWRGGTPRQGLSRCEVLARRLPFSRHPSNDCATCAKVGRHHTDIRSSWSGSSPSQAIRFCGANRFRQAEIGQRQVATPPRRERLPEHDSAPGRVVCRAELVASVHCLLDERRQRARRTDSEVLELRSAGAGQGDVLCRRQPLDFPPPRAVVSAFQERPADAFVPEQPRHGVVRRAGQRHLYS